MEGEKPLAEYEYPSLRNITGFLKEQAQVEIKGREAFKILEGLIIWIYNISNVGIQTYEDAFQLTQEAVLKDWKDIWNHGLQKLHPEYFSPIHTQIQDLLIKEYPAELKWVLKSNMFTIALDKHLVECPQVKAMMAILKEEEDKGTPLIPMSEKNTNKSNVLIDDQEPHVSSRSPENKSAQSPIQKITQSPENKGASSNSPEH